MIFLDALAMKFRNVKLRERNPKCVACGPECPEKEKIKSVENFDYAEFCQTNCNKYAMIKLPAENTISVQQFHEELQQKPQGKNYALIDVRSQVQFNIVNTNQSKVISEHIKSENVQIKEIEKNQNIFQENDKVYIMCRRGNMSKEATELALHLSHSNAFNIEGGIDSMIDLLDPSLPKY